METVWLAHALNRNEVQPTTPGSQLGARLTGGFDFRPLRVMTSLIGCGRRGVGRRLDSFRRIFSTPQGRVPDRDFTLALANRFALDTLCE